MKLLGLSVSNHRSFRDEIFFDLKKPEAPGGMLKSGFWADHTYPVALIYGANASGKTSLVHSLKFIRSAIASSAGVWLGKREPWRDPFLFDPNSANGESLYAVDFTLDRDYGIQLESLRESRYHYEFVIDAEGVQHELLQIYRSSKPTTLLQRWLEDGETRLKVGAGLGGSFDLTRHELALSRALVLRRSGLADIARAFIRGVQVIGSGIPEREFLIHQIMDELAEGKTAAEDVVSLLQAADVGITDIQLDEQEASGREGEIIQALIGLRRDARSKDKDDSKSTEEKAIGYGKLIERNLQFKHQSIGGFDTYLPLERESDGTRSWLALMPSVIRSLREGRILCIDELDASLHTCLVASIIKLFSNRETNPHGSQLIFTTHNLAFLMPGLKLKLSPEQIWITEKDVRGASELYSLGDFPQIRAKSNLAKQFIEARFGGTPKLVTAIFDSLIDPEEGIGG